MKAVILTDCESVSNSEKELINESSVFKLAVNRAPYTANIRIFQDFPRFEVMVSRYSEPLITCDMVKVYPRFKDLESRFGMLYRMGKELNDSSEELYFNTGTLVPALDYLRKHGYSEILILGDNLKNSKYFQDKINEQLNLYCDYLKIYTFTKFNNFNLPVMSIPEFLGE